MKHTKMYLSAPSAFICGALFVLGVSLYSFKEKPKETKVYVASNADYAKKIIDSWAKVGYEVKSITPEPISIAIGHIGIQKEKYGRLLIIMEK